MYQKFFWNTEDFFVSIFLVQTPLRKNIWWIRTDEILEKLRKNIHSGRKLSRLSRDQTVRPVLQNVQIFLSILPFVFQMFSPLKWFFFHCVWIKKIIEMEQRQVYTGREHLKILSKNLKMSLNGSDWQVRMWSSCLSRVYCEFESASENEC